MKYKVKNTVTGEETICEKVVLDGYDFYYTKEFPKNGDYGLTKLNTITKIGYAFEFGLYKKVIATTNKSLDLPMVIDEVKNIVEELMTIKTNQNNRIDLNAFANGVIHGWLRAKEAYSFTKEDLINFKQQAPLILEQLNGASDSELFDIWQEQRTKTILVK